MENENKDKKVILTDEELKKVDGGNIFYTPCPQLDTKVACLKNQMCVRRSGKCVIGR